MKDKLVYTDTELRQGSDEWKDIRKTCIGGSDAATVLGVNSHFDSAHTFWRRKTGKMKPKKLNEAMIRGIEMEIMAREPILEHLREVEGIKNPVIEPIFARHPQFPYIGISFDGVDIKNKFITEIKSPKFSWNFKTVYENGIQDYYYPQVQLQLMVAKAHWGIEKAYFCSYFPDGAYILNTETYIEYLKKLAVIDIDYDPIYCEAMRKVLQKFWKFVEYDYWEDEEYQDAIRVFEKELQKLRETNV